MQGDLPNRYGPFETVEALAPDRGDALDVGLSAGPDLEARIVRLEVHRQRRAQVAEAGMHFARDRAATRALGALLRQQARRGQQFMEIFGDGERVPDLDAIVGQAGDQERRRQQQQLGPRRGVVAADHLLLELQAGHFAQQPSAQRPGAVILAGDGECGLGHRAYPTFLPASKRPFRLAPFQRTDAPISAATRRAAHRDLHAPARAGDPPEDNYLAAQYEMH